MLATSTAIPVFRIEGGVVVVRPLDTVSVVAEQLDQQVASPADDGQRIAHAMDALLTRSWG